MLLRQSMRTKTLCEDFPSGNNLDDILRLLEIKTFSKFDSFQLTNRSGVLKMKLKRSRYLAQMTRLPYDISRNSKNMVRIGSEELKSVKLKMAVGSMVASLLLK